VNHYQTKFGVIFFKEIKAFIQQGCITLIKSENKDTYNITNDIQIVKESRKSQFQQND